MLSCDACHTHRCLTVSGLRVHTTFARDDKVAVSHVLLDPNGIQHEVDTRNHTRLAELIGATIAGGDTLNKGMFARTFVDQLNEERHKLGVFETEDGEVVGFVGINCTWQLHDGVRVAEVTELTVAEGYRDGDIRFQLLEWATEVACEAGCERMILSSRLGHDESHGFYETYGFTKTHYRFDKDI